MRRKHWTIIIVVVFLSWNIITYYMLSNKPAKANHENLRERLDELQSEISRQLKENEQLLSQLRVLQKQDVENDQPVVITPLPPKVISNQKLDKNVKDTVLPILLIACDRITVDRALDKLLQYRPSAEKFPIIVSQDCAHKATAAVIQKYVQTHGIVHIKQPDIRDITLPPKQRKFKGYYKIARHYKWALNQIFHTFNYSAVIIVEDDLAIAPDFFEYFAATFPLLYNSPDLFCVSAWNDNGKGNLLADEPETLYRTDFFPGLGWMIKRDVWLELEVKWPETFWDDWVRHPDQRKNRQCIRPEISRTSTFGKKGVSNGLFYEKHLKFIKLNEKFVPFTKMDLSYLEKENYDKIWRSKVYNSPLITVAELQSNSHLHDQSVRLEYSTQTVFKTLAKKFGVMDDFKAGVPRGAYQGAVTFMYQNRRVYLAQPTTWKNYNPTWN